MNAPQSNDPITLYERIAREHVFPFAKDMGGGTFTSHGLTKRELFAAMAMQGLIARGVSYSLQDAGIAVRYADAVLTALDVPK